MPVKNVTEREKSLYIRFFNVIDILYSQKIISLKAFCKTYGYNYLKYTYTRNCVRGGDFIKHESIDIDAIFSLHDDFNVSLEYLFFNKYPIFRNK